MKRPFGYIEETYFDSLYKRLKHDFHLTDIDMYIRFPDLVRERNEEQIRNVGIETHKRAKLIKFRKRKSST